MQSSLTPDEAVRAYRTLERRGSIVAAGAMACLVFLWWLEAPPLLAVPGVALVFGGLVITVKRQSALPRAVEALHSLSAAGHVPPDRRDVRTRWWHLDNTFPLIVLVYCVVYTYADGRGLVVLANVLIVAALPFFVAVEAYSSPFMPRLPGVALRLTPDGVELPKARITLRWPEIAAIWPIPDSDTHHLGLALHLADPEASLVSRRMRRAAARNGGCVFLRAGWLQAPLVELLQTAHAYKRASVEGR
ncbi:hypothetical protein HDA40_005748 [Hamadaea flava]|uniref:Uncharacterized protein n=1 Tax=Hamadaea flava TaxID=1742688 RepID=A0ABV8LQG3_9ACTN|nr:hypothetical protein [Hamadaea flava]MCP2327241.1 hypothetical protein [Hamadaea flava]